MKKLVFIIFCLVLFTSCKDSGDITASHAENLVKEYLEHNPLYETANFETYKMKLNSEKDADLIATITDLVKEDYIEIIDENSRKKWFSKDSVFTITPNLTKKALPFIVKQSKNKTEVKTVFYELDRTREINFEKKTDKVTTFNAVLLKNKTPFYSFGKDKNPNSDFITKDFKAKYFKDKGWMLVN